MISKNNLTNSVTRVEVIDEFGRRYVRNNINSTQLSFQDDDRTLKVFIS